MCVIHYLLEKYELNLTGKLKSNLVPVKRELGKNKTGKNNIHCVQFNKVAKLLKLCNSEITNLVFDIVSVKCKP